MTTRDDIIAEAVKLSEILKARGQTHGQGASNFTVMAELLNAAGYRRVRGVAGDGEQHRLDALDAVLIYKLSKDARIICGDRLEPDHWRDGAGYAIIGAAITAGEFPEKQR